MWELRVSQFPNIANVVMSLLNSFPLHFSSSTPPVSNGHFPPPPRPTLSYPSSSRRLRFTSKVKPLLSLSFPTLPIRCCSPSSMSTQASPSASQVLPFSSPVSVLKKWFLNYRVLTYLWSLYISICDNWSAFYICGKMVCISSRTAWCIQERTGSLNPLLLGMWMLEILAATYLLVKALLCHLQKMVFKVWTLPRVFFFFPKYGGWVHWINVD